MIFLFDPVPPLGIHMIPVKRCKFLWNKPYSWWRWLLTLRTFFNDFITFVKALTSPSWLFELGLKWFLFLYRKRPSSFKANASALFTSCEPEFPLLILISNLQKSEYLGDEFITYYLDEWSSYWLWWNIHDYSLLLLVLIEFLTASFLM